MNTLSIADFTSAGAECGDAGINLASLELTGIAPVGRDPDPDVIYSPDAPARAPGFLFEDGYGRDPDKYTRLEHDLPRPAPRLIREKPITYARAALIFGGLAVLFGLEVWGVVAFGKWAAGMFV